MKSPQSLRPAKLMNWEHPKRAPDVLAYIAPAFTISLEISSQVRTAGFPPNGLTVETMPNESRINAMKTTRFLPSNKFRTHTFHAPPTRNPAIINVRERRIELFSNRQPARKSSLRRHGVMKLLSLVVRHLPQFKRIETADCGIKNVTPQQTQTEHVGRKFQHGVRRERHIYVIGRLAMIELLQRAWSNIQRFQRRTPSCFDLHNLNQFSRPQTQLAAPRLVRSCSAAGNKSCL